MGGGRFENDAGGEGGGEEEEGVQIQFVNHLR